MFEKKLMHLSRFGRSRIANRDLQDEFIQFCALQLLEHKKYTRPSEYFFIDFLRQYFKNTIKIAYIFANNFTGMVLGRLQPELFFEGSVDV